MNITEKLFELQDLKYKEFHSSLVPGKAKELFIGVRVPIMRKLAKEYFLTEECEAFLATLPHRYYDEDLLHAILISELKDYDKALERVENFLPYIDNWGVCDILAPKVFKKHKVELLPKVEKWIASEHLYTSRFGMRMLMNHFLEEAFKAEYLEWPARVKTEEYYWMMMQAWFYATALAKQWEATIPYLQEQRLSIWVHNKTIQKAIESYRINAAQKDYLRTLKTQR